MDYQKIIRNFAVIEKQYKFKTFGKENDIESGLGDFGVRKYDDGTGEILNIIIRF